MEVGACPLESDVGKLFSGNRVNQMRPVIRQPFKVRTAEEAMALLSAVATAILAVIIIAMLYFGREIFVPIALAILLSFVLAPVVGILEHIVCRADWRSWAWPYLPSR
jgi:glucose-6-phosphate-specific signal transduction histidine kinase